MYVQTESAMQKYGEKERKKKRERGKERYIKLVERGTKIAR
jgi:hypothetical protein